MKTARLLILGSLLAILHAAAAGAGVSVFHVDDAVGTVPVGGTFNVDVIMAYDGNPEILSSAFVSAGWDTNQLTLINTPTASNFAIFFGPSGFLSKISDPGVFPGDPAGTLRTVQYGAAPGQSGGAGPDVVITTLQFQVVGVGDGTAAIDVIFNSGDIFAAGAPPVALSPPDATTAGVVVSVPEPASAALAFSALASVGLIAGWRNRRR